MTDNFSPDNMTVPDEQMGLWDSVPPEPLDLWDEPPDDEWLPPEPPGDWTPPESPDALPPEISDPLAPPTPGNSDTPFAEPLAPQAALSDEPAYVPSDTWERYLASFTPDKNPDIVDSEQRSRGQDLNLVDARFVGVEYQNERGEPTGYGVGCIEVYADPTQEGDAAGSYLEIAAFNDPLDAAALYDTLQTPVDKGWIADYSVHELANFAAGEHDVSDVWHTATPDDLAIYNWYAGHDLTFEPPLETDPTRSQDAAIPAEPPNPAFNALSAIGIQAADFDPAQDPPPFYDPATGTAYWIGIFQPDLEDPKNCVASVLSLGRNPETGELEAQLAPCVPGDWDKAFESSQHLLNVMEREGIDGCFLAAESMAVATDQRELWETERGMPLEQNYAEQAAEYAQETWELDL
jgi:hypothetical protein